MSSAPQRTPASTHRLQFCAVDAQLPPVLVPCDAQGNVHLDGLTDKARNAYLGARALMGRLYRAPELLRMM